MAIDQNVVFELLHIHIMPDGDEDVKTIGYYLTEADALKARSRAIKLPGFKDAPNGFHVERHIIDEDNPRKDYGPLSR